MKNINVDNLRLALKGLVTLWVPIAVAMGLIHDAQTATLVMGASVASVDLLFRVVQPGDSGQE